MSVADAAAKYEQKKEVEDWIEAGNRCVYCYGWEWKGAGYHDISQEEARKLSKTYSFGIGFYTMDWREINGEKVLYFNELSESDML